MRKQQNRSEPKQKSGFNTIMTLAMLFLAVFMAVTAVSQFEEGRIVSGCVSVLGSVLFFGLTALQLLALLRQLKSRKKNQEDHHG